MKRHVLGPSNVEWTEFSLSSFAVCYSRASPAESFYAMSDTKQPKDDQQEGQMAAYLVTLTEPSLQVIIEGVTWWIQYSTTTNFTSNQWTWTIPPVPQQVSTQYNHLKLHYLCTELLLGHSSSLLPWLEASPPTRSGVIFMLTQQGFVWVRLANCSHSLGSRHSTHGNRATMMTRSLQ